MKIKFIAKRLKHYRKLRKWSVQELAQGSGVSVRQIENIEDEAVRMVHALILEKLANALLIDLQSLLDESNPPELPPDLPGMYSSVIDLLAALVAGLGFLIALCLLLSFLAMIF